MPDSKWVFDTVSLSNFALSESIFILENRYKKKGIITSQVYDEISAGTIRYPKLKEIDGLIKNKILRLCTLTLKEREIYSQLITYLGKGEASCLALAKEQSAIAVIDDRTARRQCSQMGIPVTGTVGILKASLVDGLVDINQANDILQKMIKAGFYSPIRSIGDIL